MHNGPYSSLFHSEIEEHINQKGKLSMKTSPNILSGCAKILSLFATSLLSREVEETREDCIGMDLSTPGLMYELAISDQDGNRVILMAGSPNPAILNMSPSIRQKTAGVLAHQIHMAVYHSENW